MKAKTLQIIWHSKEPVFSIDFHPDGYIATGGGDKDIKLWELCCDGEGNPQVQYVSSLAGHSRTINCVRFSHSGHCLASAGDSGELLIWRPLPGSTAQPAASPAQTLAPAACGTPLSVPQIDSSSTPGGIPRSPADSLAAGEDGAGSAAAWMHVAAWKLSATLRGHHDDVTDIAWAHDDGVIMSGSVENEVMMFDVESRRTLARLEGHRHYVQGVAWDPLGAWMVSQSADRTVRVHGLKPPPTGSKATAAAAAKEGMRTSTALAKDVLHTHTLSKVAVQPPATPPQSGPGDQPAGAAAAGGAAGADAQQQQQAKPLQSALFHDESLNTFFRRLAWSPEGSLLAVPAGVHREYAGQQPQHATYIYARGHWGCPLLSLPCPSKASTVVRFCPRIFKLKQQQGDAAAGGGGYGSSVAEQEPPAAAAGCENLLGLPYRLVLAVATMDSVLLYDMQTCEPIMLVGPLHFAPITDLAWSRDGSCLAVSSHDGYCSMVTFQPGELAEPVDLDDAALPEGLQAALRKVQAAAAATASKGAGSAGAAAAAAAVPVSPKVVAVTPRPASAAAAADRTPMAGGQQQQQQVAKPRRVQPEAVPAATDMGVIGRSSRPASAAAAVAQPRRVTPQPVTAGQVMGAPAAFAASTAPAATPASAPASAVAAASTPAGGAASAVTAEQEGPSASPAGQQQQQQQGATVEQATPAAKAAAAPAAGAAASCGGRVGLAAVQAALAAAAKKKAAAKRAAEEIDGPGAAATVTPPAAAATPAAAGTAAAVGGGDDDVVIVGEVAGQAGANKRAKLS